MRTVRVRRPNRARLSRHSNGMLMVPEEFDTATDFDELDTYELIHQYWIIDRFQRVMTIFRGRPGPGEPAEQIIKESEVYRSPLLVGFELPLVQLLKVADDWVLYAKAKSATPQSPGSSAIINPAAARVGPP
jgi:hypothetical protein